MKHLTGFVLLLFLVDAASAQLFFKRKTEQILNAQTKQVNQFFHRFNGEEDYDGKALGKHDKKYRSDKLRSDYFKVIFDNEEPNIDPDTKAAFINWVNNNENPQYLNFHKNGWYAEVSARFKLKGQLVDVIMHMQLEPDNGGYKWAIRNLHCPQLLDGLTPHHGDERQFLHPLSHELEFMNMKKAFSDPRHVTDYMHKGYKPDMLTLFALQVQQGNMKFDQVTGLKFHILQLDGWYLELAYRNRSGMNAGWLITATNEISASDKQKLLNFINNGTEME